MIGAGAIFGRFQARLGLDETDYAKGMINAEAVSRIFGQTFTAFVSNPLLGSIDLFKNVGRAAITASVDLLGYSESIERLSQQTGASEPLLIALSKRLEIAGFNAERARQSFLKFNQFIADYNRSGPLANEILGQMNANLDGLTTFDQFLASMLDGLAAVENQATRAALASKLFGEEAGHDLINAIGGGSAALDEMIEQYTRLGFVVDRQVNSRLAAMNTNLGFMQQALEGVRSNTIREFLLGINEQLDLSDEGIIRLAETLNSRIGPAARDVGVVVEALAGSLSLVATAIEKIQGFGEDIFYLYYQADDAVKGYFRDTEVSGTLGIETSRENAAKRRNRERYLETIEELGL